VGATDSDDEATLVIPRPIWAATLLVGSLVVGLLHATCLAGTNVRMVGCFEDVKATSEHARGYRVQLWSSGSEWFGVVDRYEGPPFDPPAGLLEDIRRADPTGAVSFRTKMSFGVDQSGPTREVVVFSGVLDAVSLRGTFEVQHLSERGAARVEREAVVLKRAAQPCDDRPFVDRAAWWKSNEPILRARGPKW
jgi:hypothetical protein